MEKLNEYLQSLLSTCGYELHLEPNKNPYVVSANGTSDVAGSPILGTQISVMVFPLIPAGVKQELPNKAEVEFTYAHALGDFNFNVRKSPAGFMVTVRPLLSDPTAQTSPLTPSISAQTLAPQMPPPIIEIEQPPIVAHKDSAIHSNAPFLGAPIVEKPTYSFESASYEMENNAAAAGNTPFLTQVEPEPEKMLAPLDYSQQMPEIEIVSVNDPQFTTTFSDSSDYEPPGRRDDFAVTGNDFSAPVEPNSAPPENFQNAYVEPQNYAAEQTAFAQSFQPSAAPSAAFAPAARNDAMKTRMDALFYKMDEVGASDLHMSVSTPPMVRKDGRMQKLECGEGVLTPALMKELLSSIMPAKNQEEFARRSDTDFAYEIPGLARFRANIFADRKGMGGVFRIIPTKILTAEQLNLSPAIMNLCELSKGLVVVTGPTGSGKSTTLCAMVDSINKKREDHIITIEDPIEFTHENQKCLVNQREVHNHTDSFKDALRAALREDPDILLVGEMRDLETISIAIETAETGHLVFGTLHTTTAASTVDRIIDQFPADRQQQIRVMLSESLRGVIAQTLLPKKGGGRVAALEVLIVTPAISNLIREGKTFQIPSAMQTGKQHGMVMLNDALFALVQKGVVEPRDAYIKAVDKMGFESLLSRGGFRI